MTLLLSYMALMREMKYRNCTKNAVQSSSEGVKITFMSLCYFFSLSLKCALKSITVLPRIAFCSFFAQQRGNIYDFAIILFLISDSSLFLKFLSHFSVEITFASCIYEKLGFITLLRFF